jgi:hypothetical protein
MSWAGLANNQTISFNNLQNAVSSGIFVAKTTIPSSNEQITKADANTYVYLNTSYSPYAAKSSNQLVVKSNLQASLNAIGLSAEANESAEACGVPFAVEQVVTFSGTLGVGTQINSISVSGGSGYFLILSPLSFPQTLYVIGINDDGEVIYLENICPF